MATEDFLKDYQNCFLHEIVIPGSHDAGLTDEDFGTLGLGFGANNSNCVTQKVGVGQQAIWGSRFFDVRIIKSGGALKAYHSPRDTRLTGGVGQGFETILDQLKGFLESHPTEFVIVRLAHIRDSKEVFTALLEWMARGNNTAFVYKGEGNIANKRVSELKGNIIFVIDNKKLRLEKVSIPGGEGAKVPGQIDGFHKLYQNKRGKPLPHVQDGLCICGEFADSNSLERIVSNQMIEYTRHNKHMSKSQFHAHLYCLYWTATHGNIKENTKILTNNFSRVRKMINDADTKFLRDWVEEKIPLTNTWAWSNAIAREDRARRRCALNLCSFPNIILYDFVNEGTSNEIIKLNIFTNRFAPYP